MSICRIGSACKASVHRLYRHFKVFSPLPLEFEAEVDVDGDLLGEVTPAQ